MIRADAILPAGAWSGAPADRATLAYEDRFRRRRAMQSDGGLAFLLDLSEAAQMRGGDGLRLEDGRIIEIRAADEPVADLVPATPAALNALAWHLGNRHLAVQFLADRLRIRQDSVIEAMAAGLGATVERRAAPFDPETGARGGGHSHSHGHGHAHAHTHTQDR